MQDLNSGLQSRQRNLWSTLTCDNRFARAMALVWSDAISLSISFLFLPIATMKVVCLWHLLKKKRHFKIFFHDLIEKISCNQTMFNAFIRSVQRKNLSQLCNSKGCQFFSDVNILPFPNKQPKDKDPPPSIQKTKNYPFLLSFLQKH